MKFTVVRSQTVKSGDIARIGRDDMWVIYTTEDGHTGSVTLPAEDFDDAKLIAAVNAEEGKHGSLRGRTLGG